MPTLTSATTARVWLPCRDHPTAVMITPRTDWTSLKTRKYPEKGMISSRDLLLGLLPHWTGVPPSDRERAARGPSASPIRLPESGAVLPLHPELHKSRAAAPFFHLLLLVSPDHAQKVLSPQVPPTRTCTGKCGGVKGSL